MALGSDNQAIHSLKGRVKLKKTWYFLIERVILSVATMLAIGIPITIQYVAVAR